MKVSYGQWDVTRLMVAIVLITAYMLDEFLETGILKWVALFITAAMLFSFFFGICTSAYIGEKLGAKKID